MALDIMAAFTNEPPELDFIWPGFLAGTVGALVAPGATGKSFFALEGAPTAPRRPVRCGRSIRSSTSSPTRELTSDPQVDPSRSG